jgi:hypothetical protein
MSVIELDENSNRIDDIAYITGINIILKDHQKAIIYKCIEIENINICNFGIMSDKPGSGKTYITLSLIYYRKKESTVKKTKNIIVVPQNIIKQWCDSIHNFSNGLLSYKKFTDYADILDLYNENTSLFDYDILITTSLYYNIIATTMKSMFLKVDRVFFDEIDSISSLIINKIDANFLWFISASFNYDELGIYKKSIEKDLLPYITCKCNDAFVDYSLKLNDPNIYKIICKNIYIDHILNGLITEEEYKVLNALDYSILKRKFSIKIAENDKESYLIDRY